MRSRALGRLPFCLALEAGAEAQGLHGRRVSVGHLEHQAKVVLSIRPQWLILYENICLRSLHFLGKITLIDFRDLS